MIFPLKDSIPRLRRPYAVWTIMLVTTAVFLWQKTLPPQEFYRAVRLLGITPVYLPFEGESAFAPYLLNLLTYTFAHGGWWHLISNMWVFRIFADNIEDVMGPWRFTAFYLLCGVIAGLVHALTHANSYVPVVGASGAISGVLGAYFLFYPHARVTTFVFFLIFDLPAAVYLGGWFLLQLFSGLQEAGAEGVAWWAHLGGFVAGMVLAAPFRGNRACPAALPKPKPAQPQADPKDPWRHLRSK